MKLAVAYRNAACDAVVDGVDAGAAAGYLEIRTGTPPTNPDSAATGTLLATLPMSDPAFGAAASGVATANSITSDTSADATGTAGWARLYDSDDNPIADFDVGATASGKDIEFDDVSFVAGGTVAISSFTVTVPVGSYV